jgi:nucleoid-associated protein YgaU
MGYEQLTIIPERGERIKCQFNPERYTVTKSVQYADISIPGLDSSVVQFVRGQSEKITMELFFDTTDKGMVDGVTDVRESTNRVFMLLRVNSDTHAPLRVKLEWGPDKRVICFGTNTSAWSVLESVSQEFTLFSPNGTPLRAKLNVSFREAWTVEQQLQETPCHTSDRTKVITVQAGQTLSQIAAQEYDDPGEWRVIAEANKLSDPANLEPAYCW